MGGWFSSEESRPHAVECELLFENRLKPKLSSKGCDGEEYVFRIRIHHSDGCDTVLCILLSSAKSRASLAARSRRNIKNRAGYEFMFGYWL